MPSAGLCRVDASRYASCLVGAVNVLMCSAYSQGFEEGQQCVRWPVAAGRGCWRGDSGEGFLLESKVRVQIDLGGLDTFVVQPSVRHRWTRKLALRGSTNLSARATVNSPGSKPMSANQRLRCAINCKWPAARLDE